MQRICQRQFIFDQKQSYIQKAAAGFEVMLPSCGWLEYVCVNKEVQGHVCAH
jgi:hypothetical protein